VSAPQQDQVWLVTLDPTQGVEIQKTRPCLVISPDEMNPHLRTVIIAPMTTDHGHPAVPHARGGTFSGETRAGGAGPTPCRRPAAPGSDAGKGLR